VAHGSYGKSMSTAIVSDESHTSARWVRSERVKLGLSINDFVRERITIVFLLHMCLLTYLMVE
jgi:hypothetical protein